jgi:Uma2 family endonuclease
MLGTSPGGEAMAIRRSTATGAPEAIPPLREGDRLTREEFERRYEAMPELKKAELIEGVVYLGSPVKQREHSEPNGATVGLCVLYSAATPGVNFGTNGTTRLDLPNEFQPDAFLRLEQEVGGQSHIGQEGYVEGAPELVIEVASSSAPIDLREKRQVYERTGVKEYGVWLTRRGRIVWLRSRDGKFVEVAPVADGVIRSEVFPGFWLAVDALLKRDFTSALAVLQAGLASPEHVAFVERLRKAREST